MDPLECLLRAKDAISDGDAEEAWDSLDSFREWRALGGFNVEVPHVHTYGLGNMTGDQFYDHLLWRYASQFLIYATLEELYDHLQRGPM